MADKRRLQAEIDKCLKKVTDGCDGFDEIWQKFNTSTQITQKERLEQELKREIKKLQRFRDQIKTWVNTNDIRNKDQLTEFRRKIESRMERFKVVEKETKTKAYSKEGLGAMKLDPAAKEKSEMEAWLKKCLTTLEVQIDQFESEMERVGTLGSKKKKDKKRDEKLAALQEFIERHQFHTKTLETVLRLFNNDAIEVNEIKRIQDNVDYYLEANQEEGYEEPGDIYYDLKLEELAEEIDVKPIVIHAELNSNHENEHILHNSNSTNHSSKEDDRTRHRSSTNSDEGKQTNGPTTIKPAPAPSLSINNNKNISTSQTPSSPLPTDTQKLPSVPTTPVNLYNSTTPPLLTQLSNLHISGPTISYSNAASDSVQASQSGSQTSGISDSRTSVTPPKCMTPNSTSGSSINNSATPPVPSPAPSPSVSISNEKPDAVQSSSREILHQNGPTILGNSSNSISSSLNGTLSKGIPSEQTSLPRTMAQSPLKSHNNSLPSTNETQLESTSSHSQITSVPPPKPELKSVNASIRISPLLGIAPLGPVKLKKDNHYQAEMLESAYTHMPTPADSERVRPYLPRNPIPTPGFYPQTFPVQFDTQEYFHRLTPETLFFIFYYMEGTKAQYMAAKALKKQSWRFHTKYYTWFQRHDEPRQITDEFEQGTYIFFDFEKWTQRRKEGFTFEYRYLEDKELP